MKRFRFSLQTLHDLRELERENAERALAQSARNLAEAADRVEKYRRECDSAWANQATKLQAREPDLKEIAMHTDYITTLERRLTEAQARYAELERERELRFQQVLKAAAAAEVTAKLREQQRGRHQAEVAREDQNQLDELATIAVARHLRETA